MMTEQFRRLFMALALAGVSCPGGGQPPQPPAPPTPPPAAHEPVCPPSGATCGCWFQAPGEEWEQLPPCPTPGPIPTPTPVPAPAPPASFYLAQCGPITPSTTVELVLVLHYYPLGGRHNDVGFRVRGDVAFCRRLHGDEAVADCNLEPLPQPARANCAMGLIGRQLGYSAACPRFQYRDGTGGPYPCRDDHAAENSTSCDHFGDASFRDDPQTPTTGTTLETLRGFEGLPAECGLDRDDFGPRAGFFATPHGTPGRPSETRACLPDGSVCTDWLPVKSS